LWFFGLFFLFVFEGGSAEMLDRFSFEILLDYEAEMKNNTAMMKGWLNKD
jgi:hypothetical protein